MAVAVGKAVRSTRAGRTVGEDGFLTQRLGEHFGLTPHTYALPLCPRRKLHPQCVAYFFVDGDGFLEQ